MASKHLLLGLFCALLGSSLTTAAARAQAEPAEAAPTGDVAHQADEAEPIWAKGVSPERRAQAQRLLEQGNGLFLRGDHRAALTVYQEALESWDHPAIRFNLARALIQLDRTLEAYENVEQALRHGPSALEEHVYAEAQGYLRLLRGQIGEIEVRCAQPGTEVRVDGRPFLACPGQKRERILPGPHVLLTSGAGFLPESRDILVQAAKPESFEVELMPLSEATRTERRWPVWQPWVVIGGGAVLFGMAGVLRWQAKTHNDEYGADVARLCQEMPCTKSDLPLATRKLERRADRENTSALAVGGVAAASTVAGLVLVLLNLPRQVVTSEPRRAMLAPLLSREAAGLSLTASF
jgi:tetratricopeptide (TPR) repeat protein